MDISLRQATSQDIDYLIGLRDLTMGPHLAAAGLPTDRDALRERVNYLFEHALVIEIDGDAAGLFKAAFNADIHQWYLFQLQVHPDYQNRRIGSSLLRSLLTQADEAKASVGLSVLKQNPAKAMYESLGFERVGETEYEYMMEYRLS